MSERKDEQWLDDQLRRAVDGTTPVFDAEAWKRKHRDEYRIMLSRGKADEQHVGPGLPHRNLHVVLRTWIGKLAVAAAIAVAVGLLVLSRSGRGPDRPILSAGPVAQSPASMMSMMSLRMAYEQGGFDELDRQLQSTLDEFGPRSASVSLQELF